MSNEELSRLFARILDHVDAAVLVYVPGEILYRNDVAPDPIRDLDLDAGMEEARRKWFQRYQLFDADDPDHRELEPGEGPIALMEKGESIENRLYRIRQRATGHERVYEVSCRPFRLSDESDAETGFIVTTHDLTHRAGEVRSGHRRAEVLEELLDVAAPASLMLDDDGHVLDRRAGDLEPIAELEPHLEGRWHSRYRLRRVEDGKECRVLEDLVWPTLRGETLEGVAFEIEEKESSRTWKVLIRTAVAEPYKEAKPPSDEARTLLTFSPIA